MEQNGQQGGQGQQAQQGTQNGAPPADDAADLRSQLHARDTEVAKLSNSLKEATSKLKAFEGIDPKKVKDMQSQFEKMQQDQAQSSPEALEEWKKSTRDKVRSEFAEELEKLRTDNAQLLKTNKTLEITDRALNAIGDLFHKNLKEVLIRPLIEKHVDKGENGEIIVKDEKGNPMYSRSNPAKPMSLEEFGTHLADLYPEAAVSNYKGGSQTQGGQKAPNGASQVVNGRRLVPPPAGFLSWSGDAQQKWFSENPEASKLWMEGKL